MFSGIAPKDMLKKEEMLLLNFSFAVEEGVGLQQRQRLTVAAVRGEDIFLI